MQPIRELDENDAHIARHRQQHFAEIFRLCFFEGGELELVQFGNTIDQIGNRLAEFFGDVSLGGRRILDHVVQQRRDQCLRIEMPAREDFGNRKRVGDVRLARLAHLAFMRGGRHRQCRLDLFQVDRFEIRRNQFAQRNRVVVGLPDDFKHA